MEEAKKQLEIHGILEDYPRMKKENEELERKNRELQAKVEKLSSQIASLKEANFIRSLQGSIEQTGRTKENLPARE